MLQSIQKKSSSQIGGCPHAQSVLESMLETKGWPKLALDPQGHLLWISERAQTLLASGKSEWKVPPDLAGAARHLCSLTETRSSPASPISSWIPSGNGQSSLAVELRLVRTSTGASFVMVELMDLPERCRLTKAEVHVLALVAEGLSNREIARRIFISTSTVHSHLKSVMSKLDVRSRTRAALVAHGIFVRSSFIHSQ
ncbi:MAG TPA: LuxR C-terminal-related transcriptional regulator [bacterium]|nr:LuxR C-terminal-related transcriptional regulator [bacterium]